MTDNAEGRSSAARRKSAPRNAHTQISQGVASGIAERQYIVGKGGNDLVERVKFNNETSAIHKIVIAEEFADAEYLASILGRAIDAPVPAVLQTKPNEVYIQLMPGEPAAFVLGDSEDAALPYVQTVDGLMLGVLDATIGNFDRHGGNWLIDGDRIYGIDHAEVDTEAGVTGDDYHQLTLPGRGSAISPFASHWLIEGDRGQETWKDNTLHPTDVEHWKNMAIPVSATFKNRGYEHWWQAILERFEAIEFYAKGERPWIGIKSQRKPIPTHQPQSLPSRTSRERSSPSSPSHRRVR